MKLLLALALALALAAGVASAKPPPNIVFIFSDDHAYQAIKTGGYVTDIITDTTLEWLAKRDKSKPI